MENSYIYSHKLKGHGIFGRILGGLGGPIGMPNLFTNAFNAVKGLGNPGVDNVGKLHVGKVGGGKGSVVIYGPINTVVEGTHKPTTGEEIAPAAKPYNALVIPGPGKVVGVALAPIQVATLPATAMRLADKLIVVPFRITSPLGVNVKLQLPDVNVMPELLIVNPPY
jgi:hypothetical protein